MQCVVRRAVPVLLAALLPACSNWTGFGFDPRGSEMQRIREALPLKAGMTIADIGAGRGELSAALASEVGTSGRIFATEVDRDRIDGLSSKFARENLANIVVLGGGTSDTHLPRACCD